MALSSPPPSNSTIPPTPTPTITIATTTNSPLTRPLFPTSPPTSNTLPLPPTSRPPCPTPTNLIYPLSSTGRGYFPNPPLNFNIYTSRPAIPFQNQPRPALINNPAPGHGFRFMAPPHNFHPMLATSSSTVVNGLPIAKMGSNQTAVVDSNGIKEARDRSREDSFMIIRDRKVRVSEGSSLYALCRSWLRNGLPEEAEPQYIDIVKSLPRPLPLAPPDSQSPGKKEEEEELEEEGGGFVEHLSPKDLLQKHIKRAKRVRSRLREERLRRIARYKTRLSLLLPPIVEQHYRNESNAGNGKTS